MTSNALSALIGKSPNTPDGGAAPHHLLAYHCLDVAAVLWVAIEENPRLLDRLAATLGGTPGQVRPMLLAILAMHDTGKCGAFQTLFPDAARRLGWSLEGLADYDAHRHAHWRLTDSILCEYARKVGRPIAPVTKADRDARTALRLLIALSAGHHGGMPGADPLRSLNEAGVSRQFRECDLEAGLDLAHAFVGLFGWDGWLPQPGRLRRASFVLNGLFTACDWLGSHERFALREDPMPLDRYLREVAIPAARDVLAEIRPASLTSRERPTRLPFRRLFASLARDGREVEPTPLQGVLDDMFAAPSGPAFIVIEDATGTGKTEAGDLVVHRLVSAGVAEGGFFALPTMATADGAFGRRAKIADHLAGRGADIVLSHGRKHLNGRFTTASTRAGVEDSDASAHAWFASGSKRALLADLGVGTVDQALAGAFRARFATLRLWGLWGKVLVVDEVHAYDDYMQAALRSLIEHHAAMGGSTVLLSATLPAATRRDLARAHVRGAGLPEPELDPGIPYPAVTVVDAGGLRIGRPRRSERATAMRPVTFSRLEGGEDEAVKRLVELAADGRCAIWYRNTVTDAMRGWGLLSRASRARGLRPPLLLHSRLAYADRLAAEELVENHFGKDSGSDERRGVILVSTQAGEQSLDLDADEMVIDLAPMEAVLQRIGRRRRHARSAEGLRIEDDHPDERPPSPVWLLCEEPSAGARSGWYEGQFRGASYVYRDDAALWATASLLLNGLPTQAGAMEPREIVPYVHARDLVETVYDDVRLEAFLAGRGAPGLMPARHAWRGSARGDSQQADRRLLMRQSGLLDAWTSGSPDMDDTGENVAATRLGESHSVTLLVEQGGGIEFLHPGGNDPIEMSSVRVRKQHSAPPEDGSRIEEWISKLRSSRSMRRRLSWASLLLLRPGTNPDTWVGRAVVDGRTRRVRYHRHEGLLLEAACR